MQVLLAEDDRAVRESLVRALTLEGHEVRAVTNGAHGLDEELAATRLDRITERIEERVYDTRSTGTRTTDAGADTEG